MTWPISRLTLNMEASLLLFTLLSPSPSVPLDLFIESAVGLAWHSHCIALAAHSLCRRSAWLALASLKNTGRFARCGSGSCSAPSSFLVSYLFFRTCFRDLPDDGLTSSAKLSNKTAVLPCPAKAPSSPRIKRLLEQGEASLPALTFGFFDFENETPYFLCLHHTGWT